MWLIWKKTLPKDQTYFGFDSLVQLRQRFACELTLLWLLAGHHALFVRSRLISKAIFAREQMVTCVEVKKLAMALMANAG
jgi:hypothetical protein